MSVPFDGGGDQHLLKLAAARVVASERMPYLSSVIYAMVPVKAEGLGTFASDDRWRMYWDPKKVDEWDVQMLAGVVLHEAYHCFLGHGPRFKAMHEPAQNARLFNVAGDSLINVDLRDISVDLPEGAVYVEMLPNAKREMSSEQIYRLLVEQACSCDDSQQGQPQSGDQQGDDSQQGQPQSGDQQGDQQGDSEDSQQGQSQSGDQQGDGEGSQQGQSQSGQGQEEGQGSGNCPVHNSTPEGWDCGSSADGIRREYEAAGDAVDPGIDDARADLIREQAAVEIVRHNRSRGDVPGGLLRAAKDIVEPVVDWRRELASLVRRRVATVKGRRDYTYSRPSRRQAAMKATGQSIILPAMRQPPPPHVAIVIDTSGSMSDEMLAWAIGETQGVLRNAGSTDQAVRIYSCDSRSAAAQRVRRAEDIKLTGGGGTDMRVGIEAAMSEMPRPDAVILITDGYTPYPDEPLANGAPLIVALTAEGAADSVPEWARKVIVTR